MYLLSLTRDGKNIVPVNQDVLRGAGGCMLEKKMFDSLRVDIGKPLML